jgi:hypothetical protein
MKMDMSSSARRLLNIKLVSKDRPFYDQYDFVLCIKQAEISVLRSKSHAAIDMELDHRQSWRGQLGSRNFGGSWRSHQREITPEVRDNCHALLDFLQKESGYKIWFSQDWAYVYSNELSFLRKVETLPYLTPVELRRAVVDQERNTVLVKKSVHSRRSYLRSWKPSESQADSLRKFLANQEDVRLSPSLQDWISNDRWHYVRENFFIDHDDDRIELMLALILPRPIRKTVTIKHHK